MGTRRAGRARQVRPARAARSSPKDRRRRSSRVRTDDRRHGRTAARSCSCADRSCAAGSRIATSPIVYGYAGTELPVYFNQAPVLNAGGSGAAEARRRRRIRTPASGRSSRRTPRRCGSRRSSPTRPTARRGHRAAGRAPKTPPAGPRRRAPERIGRGDVAPRVVLAVPADPTRCCCRARWPTASSSPSRAAAVDGRVGDGPRRDVRDPAVLALADARHLHARVQRHHELERSGCWQVKSEVRASVGKVTSDFRLPDFFSYQLTRTASCGPSRIGRRLFADPHRTHACARQSSRRPPFPVRS